MAPQLDTASGVKTASKKPSVALPQTKAQALQLLNIRNALPPHVFKKDLAKSLYYMFFDYAMWLGSTSIMYVLAESNAWPNLPAVAQWAAWFIYINIAGFFMWCIFVVGHDCGHTTFSEYEWLNDIIGHITHSSIMVPYYPWRLSHRRHHLYHNHVDKDYSHPWYTPDRMEDPKEALYQAVHEMPWFTASFPIYGWFIYLWGKPDGNHYIPLPSDVSSSS